MSKNVTVQGASFSDVPGLLLPETGGGTAYFVDTSDATATAADIDSGKTAYVNGVKITGTGSGGGGGGVQENDVNFLDYDGTIVASYSKTDFASLSALPANPSHTGLTAQGWNWTLADAKTFVAKYSKLNIGQMYITDDEKTRIYIAIPADMTQRYMEIQFKAASNGGVTIDWGDGTTELSSGTSMKSYSHKYNAAGDYTIKLTPASVNTLCLGGNSAHDSLFASKNYRYAKLFAKRVEIGKVVNEITGAFANGINLESITIPTNVVIGAYTFYRCNNIKAIIVSTSTTALGNYCMNSCTNAAFSIPKTVTGYRNYFMSYSKMERLVVNSGTTSLNNYALTDAWKLKYLDLPDTITSLQASFSGSAPVIEEYHIRATTPPTLGSGTALYTSPDSVIYVPSASLNAYKTASNWSNYAGLMVGE